jgi:hypothetical protein
VLQRVQRGGLADWWCALVVICVQGCSVEFDVTLNAKGSIPLGKKQVELPLEGEARGR